MEKQESKNYRKFMLGLFTVIILYSIFTATVTLYIALSGIKNDVVRFTAIAIWLLGSPVALIARSYFKKKYNIK